MKISLRKAHEIQNRIDEFIKRMTCEEKVDIFYFQSFDDGMQEVRRLEKGYANLCNLKLKLLEVKTNIRKNIDSVNHSSGISDKLAEIAKTEQEKEIHRKMSSVRPRQSKQILIEKLKHKKENSDQDRYEGDVFQVSIFDHDDIKIWSDNFRHCERRIRELREEVLALNIKNDIAVKRDDVVVLETADIL